MSTINAILAKNILPDAMIRLGIRQRLAETLRENKQPTVEAQRAALLRYVQELKQMPVAIASAASLTSMATVRSTIRPATSSSGVQA